MPVARWTKTAVDLSEDLGEVGGYLTLAQVCERTGLAEATVMDAMLRPVIDDAANPKGAICRPAARIGGQMRPTPLWSAEQVDEYARRSAARDTRSTQAARGQLEKVSPEQAAARGLASIEAIAADLGLAVNTLRRYARDYRATFPSELAIVSTPQGTPLGYRNAAAVAQWIVAHEGGSDAGAGEGKAPLATAV